MQSRKSLQTFTVNELESSQDIRLTNQKKGVYEYLQLFSLKMRSNESYEFSKIVDITEQLEVPNDQKGKEYLKKPQIKFNRINVGIIRIYEGFGSNRRLELYLKAVEAKPIIEKAQNVNETTQGLVSKFLKKNSISTSLLRRELLEATFIKSNKSRAKYPYKSITNIGVK